MIKRFFYDKRLFIGEPFTIAKEKKPVHLIQMTEGKHNMNHQLLEEYDIQTAGDNGIIQKLTTYMILRINIEVKKEVLTIQVGNNESAKYWLSVLNELKNAA